MALVYITANVHMFCQNDLLSKGQVDISCCTKMPNYWITIICLLYFQRMHLITITVACGGIVIASDSCKTTTHILFNKYDDKTTCQYSRRSNPV